ncbi:AMP-binding protein [Natronorarus salvus]|uniref:AMP-binding protein n=1 Tax=Natronorarus salvus TaxID=3117733 RepID=UPI002F26BDF5
MTNLVGRLGESAATYAERPALAHEDRETSYEELLSVVRRFAAGLEARGIGPGDRVGLALSNLPQFVVAALGTLGAGGVLVPFGPRQSPSAIAASLDDVGADLVIAHDGDARALRGRTAVPVVTVGSDETVEGSFSGLLSDRTAPVRPRGAEDPALLAQVDVESGLSRRVVLTHGNILAAAAVAGAIVPGGIDPTDRNLGSYPLWHAFGLTTALFPTMLAGACYRPTGRWSPEKAIRALSTEPITLWYVTPAMVRDALAVEGGEPNALRFCLSVGGSLTAEEREAAERGFDVGVHVGYGRSETSTVTHVNAPDEGAPPGSVGRPVLGVDVSVLTEEYTVAPPVETGPIGVGDALDVGSITGEVVVTGPTILREYFGDPVRTRDAVSTVEGNRLFHTGETAYRDEAGHLYPFERASDGLRSA